MDVLYPVFMSDRYHIVITEDGSPTFSRANRENMHSLQGALGETLHVYGSALEKAVASGLELRVISVGMGLGYNELLTAAWSSQMDKPILSLQSFEQDPLLSESFLKWIQNDSGLFSNVYEQIALRMESRFLLPKGCLRKRLRDLLLQQIWQVCPALRMETRFLDRAHVILYDPYSENENSELWSAEFISRFLRESSSEECIFATYASRGGLKRVLRNLNFDVLSRPGFGKKRESTLAVRRNYPPVARR